MNAAPSVPGIDPDAIRLWCEVVFGAMDGLAPVRLLSEAGTPDRKPLLRFPGVVDLARTLIAEALRAGRDGRGVFVVPGTVVRPGSAKAADIIQTGVILVDLDAGDMAAKRDHLVQQIGAPTLEIASGGFTSGGQAKLHLYWRLAAPAVGDDLLQVCRLRRCLAEKVGGDTAFGSAHQPIRVPGTIHGKNGHRAPVRLMTHRAAAFDLPDLAARITAMPMLPSLAPGPGAAPKSTARPKAANLATTPIRSGGQDGLSRFVALSMVIGHRLRTVREGQSTLEDAWLAVQQHNAAMIVPPWTEERLRREFDALLQRDVQEKGPMPSIADPGTSAATVPPALSEDALAAVFVRDRGADWASVAALGWLHWDGRRWQRDVTSRVREEVRQVCRAATAGLDSPREARRIASDRTIAAVLRIAAADPAIACPADVFDAYPMLLNTPDGMVDLDTEKTRPHDRDCRLTQMTGTSPGQACPRWMAFLAEVTGGDVALQGYLARLAGYCLTGSNREQVFAFFHGPGGNGKSVFLQTLAAALGDYAATATLDTFMATAQGRHLTELAGLRAARLVIVPETEAGRSWAEGRIKMITGGERIRANFMRQDHFEYLPQFKLIIAGNHRPALNGVGEAMRRRLHLVPFEVTIPPGARDPRLTSTLQGELPGILGWMIAGCRDWQQQGLAPPARITCAVDDYLAEEDLFGQWIDECCATGPRAKAQSLRLYQCWKSWAEARGLDAGSQRSLGEELRRRGFIPTKVAGARGWQGIALPGSGDPA